MLSKNNSKSSKINFLSQNLEDFKRQERPFFDFPCRRKSENNRKIKYIVFLLVATPERWEFRPELEETWMPGDQRQTSKAAVERRLRGCFLRSSWGARGDPWRPRPHLHPPPLGGQWSPSQSGSCCYSRPRCQQTHRIWNCNTEILIHYMYIFP